MDINSAPLFFKSKPNQTSNIAFGVLTNVNFFTAPFQNSAGIDLIVLVMLHIFLFLEWLCCLINNYAAFARLLCVAIWVWWDLEPLHLPFSKVLAMDRALLFATLPLWVTFLLLLPYFQLCYSSQQLLLWQMPILTHKMYIADTSPSPWKDCFISVFQGSGLDIETLFPPVCSYLETLENWFPDRFGINATTTVCFSLAPVSIKLWLIWGFPKPLKSPQRDAREVISQLLSDSSLCNQCHCEAFVVDCLRASSTGRPHLPHTTILSSSCVGQTQRIFRVKNQRLYTRQRQFNTSSCFRNPLCLNCFLLSTGTWNLYAVQPNDGITNQCGVCSKSREQSRMYMSFQKSILYWYRETILRERSWIELSLQAVILLTFGIHHQMLVQKV